jgi:ubiquinone/menaquinone biosynthesis C-methylase UbiE
LVANPFEATDVGTVYDAGRPFHHPRTLARIRARVGTTPLDHALDVACGTGMSTVALAAPARHVTGIDVSTEMMRAARRADNVSYCFASAEALPIAAASIDAVTCCSGIHWFDQTRFFAELRRVLRPGGWVGLYDHYFMRVRACPEFRGWVEKLFQQYPLPPRGTQVGAPETEVPDGFELVADETFDDDIEMTQDQFVDYQLTVSHCVAAVERGTPRADVRAWLMQSTTPLFSGEASKTVRFFAAIRCLRVLS